MLLFPLWQIYSLSVESFIYIFQLGLALIYTISSKTMTHLMTLY